MLLGEKRESSYVPPKPEVKVDENGEPVDDLEKPSVSQGSAGALNMLNLMFKGKKEVTFEH